MESVEYVCPCIIIVIIAILKISVDNKISIENIKRVIIELSIDVMSLATSLIVSYLISLTRNTQNVEINKFANGFLIFVGYILGIIITVLISKYSIRRYSETQKNRYLIIGLIIGYIISISCLYHAIILL